MKTIKVKEHHKTPSSINYFNVINTKSGDVIIRVASKVASNYKNVFTYTMVNRFDDDSFLGTELKLMDDGWVWAKNNLWIFDADWTDPKKHLLKNGYIELECSEFMKMAYSGK